MLGKLVRSIVLMGARARRILQRADGRRGLARARALALAHRMRHRRLRV